jgi:cbb3-type cytochrome oxidase subunit 3
MLRNVKHYLASDEGLAMLDMISTVIFFAVFIGVIIYVWKMPKKKIDELKNMPFNDKNE